MPISMAMKLAQLSKQTGKVVVSLISISSDELVDDINITGNGKAIISNSVLYTYRKCDVILPDEGPDTDSSTTVTIGNVTREIDILLAPLVEKPSVTISYVLEDTPDTIEIGPGTFLLEYVSSDAFTLEGSLSGNNELDEIVPKDDINPSNCPGSF